MGSGMEWDNQSPPSICSLLPGGILDRFVDRTRPSPKSNEWRVGGERHITIRRDTTHSHLTLSSSRINFACRLVLRTHRRPSFPDKDERGGDDGTAERTDDGLARPLNRPSD